MARASRTTRLVDRFLINKEDERQCQQPFVQNNGNTFTFSTGTEGIEFSLSDSDLLDLVTNRRKRRIVFESQPVTDEPPVPRKAVRKRTGGRGRYSAPGERTATSH